MTSEMEEEVTRGWLNETSAEYCPREHSSFNNRKLYVGFFRKNLSENQLKEYFLQFGQIDQVVILRDGFGVSRGFGFVTFTEESFVDKVLANKPHTLFNIQLETRRAFPRDGQSNVPLTIYSKTKVFVGGLPKSVTKEDVTLYFEKLYSVSPLFSIENISIPVDNMGRPKGFAFVTFGNEDIVDKIMYDNRKAEICGKVCEIKRVELREDEINSMNQKATASQLQNMPKLHDENIKPFPNSSQTGGLHLLSSSTSNSNTSRLRLVSSGIEKMKKATLTSASIMSNIETDTTNIVNDGSHEVNRGSENILPPIKRNAITRNDLEVQSKVSAKLDQETLANIGSMFIDLVSNAVEAYGNTSAGLSMNSLVLNLLNQIILNAKKGI